MPPRFEQTSPEPTTTLGTAARSQAFRHTWCFARTPQPPASTYSRSTRRRYGETAFANRWTGIGLLSLCRLRELFATRLDGVFALARAQERLHVRTRVADRSIASGGDGVPRRSLRDEFQKKDVLPLVVSRTEDRAGAVVARSELNRRVSAE